MACGAGLWAMMGASCAEKIHRKALSISDYVRRRGCVLFRHEKDRPHTSHLSHRGCARWSWSAGIQEPGSPTTYLQYAWSRPRMPNPGSRVVVVVCYCIPTLGTNSIEMSLFKFDRRAHGVQIPLATRSPPWSQRPASHSSKPPIGPDGGGAACRCAMGNEGI